MSAARFALLLLPSLLACETVEPEVATNVTPVVDVAEPMTTTAPMWAGCDEYIGDTCLLVDDGTLPELRFWLDLPTSEAIVVRADALQVATVSTAADAGSRHQLSVPVGTRELVIEGRGVAGRLDLAWHSRDPLLASALEAFDVANAKQGCERLKQVSAHASAFDRLTVRQLESQHCREFTVAQAVEEYNSIAEIARLEGLRKALAFAGTSAMFLCLEYTSNRECAQSWGQKLAEDPLPDTRASILNQQAMLSEELGLLSQAYGQVLEAEQLAERLGQDAEFEAAFSWRVTIAARLGRSDAASEGAERIVALARTRAEPCSAARLMHNAAWSILKLREAGFDLESPVDWLVEESAIYEEGLCVDSRAGMIVRVDLADALLSDGDEAAALQWLTLIRSETLTDATVDLEGDIEALATKIALSTNRWELAPAPLLARARSSAAGGTTDWAALVRDAQVLERFGLMEAALEAWREAEGVLDSELLGVHGGDGRETFVSTRVDGTLGLVEALLARGELKEGLCRIRLARGRAMRGSLGRRETMSRPELARFEAFTEMRTQMDREAVEDWAYSGDELERRRLRRQERTRDARAAATIPTGFVDDALTSQCSMLQGRAEHEMLLAILPAQGSTIVIADGPAGLYLHRAPSIPEGDTERRAWARTLLEQFNQQLVGVSVLRVLPVGDAWTVEFHAAAPAGVPLVVKTAVVYGLDLPRISRSVRSRIALVLGDPREDLPQAEEERVLVSEGLRSSGWSVLAPHGASVTRASVLLAMGDADLLHYAGHGMHRGEDGWDSALLLGRDSTIEVADILTAPGVPHTVILAGCETGEVRAALVDGGMSLGRAFLLAGSEHVLVGDSALRDVEAGAFVGRVYAHARQGHPFELVPAVRAAYLTSWNAATPIVDWSGFRVLVR